MPVLNCFKQEAAEIREFSYICIFCAEIILPYAPKAVQVDFDGSNVGLTSLAIISCLLTDWGKKLSIGFPVPKENSTNRFPISKCNSILTPILV